MLQPFAAVARQYPGYPTVFRLPLRRAGSRFGKKWDVHAVKALMDRFLDDQATVLVRTILAQAQTLTLPRP